MRVYCVVMVLAQDAEERSCVCGKVMLAGAVPDDGPTGLKLRAVELLAVAVHQKIEAITAAVNERQTLSEPGFDPADIESTHHVQHVDHRGSLVMTAIPP
jgi:hypothetical protein